MVSSRTTKIMKAEERFKKIEESYRNEFAQFNGYEIQNIWYENGWVWLKSASNMPASKHRVKDIERMTDVLKSRNCG